MNPQDLGFESMHSYDEYEDFQRWPEGWGSDGHARTETVTCVNGECFYATIRDVEPDGLESFYLESPSQLSLIEAHNWLIAQRGDEYDMLKL